MINLLVSEKNIDTDTDSYSFQYIIHKGNLRLINSFYTL